MPTSPLSSAKPTSITETSSTITIIICVILGLGLGFLIFLTPWIKRKINRLRIERGQLANEGELMSLRPISRENSNRDIAGHRVLRIRCFENLGEDLGERLSDV